MNLAINYLNLLMSLNGAASVVPTLHSPMNIQFPVHYFMDELTPSTPAYIIYSSF
jgi:hypothetical protein